MAEQALPLTPEWHTPLEAPIVEAPHAETPLQDKNKIFSSEEIPEKPQPDFAAEEISFPDWLKGISQETNTPLVQGLEEQPPFVPQWPRASQEQAPDILVDRVPVILGIHQLHAQVLRVRPAPHARLGIHRRRHLHEVHVAGKPIELTPTEFDLLKTLMEYPGHAFTRQSLIEQGLGFNYEGMERTLDSHVRNLRRKIEPDPAEPSYIRTVFGVGYRLQGPE
ncbi:MAG: winged helix-turn-helix transcriptional regulator [Chloroflexi bacterium]|nr:winged helix-turn-helix transcriptional regulator [Chloroflexota bacterium]